MEKILLLTYPLIAAYLARAINNDDRGNRQSSPPDLLTATWYVCSYLGAGLCLEDGSYQVFDPNDVEALMKDRELFHDSPEARWLREATRLYLELGGASPADRQFRRKVVTGRDLGEGPSRASHPPKLALRPARTNQQLTLYELIRGLASPDKSGEVPAGSPCDGLVKFLRRVYLDLPCLERRVLKFRAIKDLTWREVGSKTGLPIASACRKYNRAVKKLALALESWDESQGGSPPHSR